MILQLLFFLCLTSIGPDLPFEQYSSHKFHQLKERDHEKPPRSRGRWNENALVSKRVRMKMLPETDFEYENTVRPFEKEMWKDGCKIPPTLEGHWREFLERDLICSQLNGKEFWRRNPLYSCWSFSGKGSVFCKERVKVNRGKVRLSQLFLFPPSHPVVTKREFPHLSSLENNGGTVAHSFVSLSRLTTRKGKDERDNCDRYLVNLPPSTGGLSFSMCVFVCTHDVRVCGQCLLTG